MTKGHSFLLRFLKFTLIFAVIYTILILLIPYFRTPGSLLRIIAQVSITSVLYGLIMAVLQPKIQVNKYTKKKDKDGEKE